MASTDDILTGLAAMADAEPGYIEAKENFEGTRPEFFASRRIARKIGESGKRFRINIAKKPVTAVVDRLEVAAVTVVGNGSATDRLRHDVWEANELGLEAPIIHRKACEFGDEYVFLTEGVGDDGEPNGTVEIERSGALTTRIIYDPERPRRPKYAIKSWEIGHGEKRRRRVNLYYPVYDPEGCRIERWITRKGEKGSDPEHWIPYTEVDPESGEESLPAVEDLERFPVYHFRTDRPYGVPLHVDAYGGQAILNKLMVTLMATVDQQGYPTRYALTDGAASEGDSDDDDFGDLDDDNAGVVDEKDRASKLRSGPGEVWWLEGASKAGQFDAADPDAFLKPADWVVRMSAQATDTPLHMYDPGGDQPSGDSRRAALDTLVKKVGFLSLSFGSTWKRLLSDALGILDPGLKGIEVDVRWAPFDAVDDLEGWQTVAAKIDAGVPVAQALTEAGYTPEQVEEWMKASGSEQDLARRVAMIAEIAKIARDLGTASGMGVVPDGLVQEILRSALPATEDPAEV